jgi:hypothetical protein
LTGTPDLKICLADASTTKGPKRFKRETNASIGNLAESETDVITVKETAGMSRKRSPEAQQLPKFQSDWR